MKLTFEPNLEYQQQAIKAVTDLFEGQLVNEIFDDFALSAEDNFEENLINAIGNKLVISNEQIFKNLLEVQKNNELSSSIELQDLHFSIEMETGTGKTYCYLRTIYELNQKYGFKKFVIVVPSVAIREGVLKNLEITHEHFQNIYDKTPINFRVYDSTKISALRSFAMGDSIEILVLNIDSFAKDENIINKPNDKLNGQTPISFIKAGQPIVIVDEPQNMETEKRIKAIINLNPLCTLRYSATHKTQYNLIYSLNPVKAYDLGLVKQIEVDSVIEENANNDAFIALESIISTKNKIITKVTISVNNESGVAKKTINIRSGDDLYKLSNQREIYSDGYIVEEIDALNKIITFSNGKVLRCGETQGNLNDEIMKFQISRTIEEHLKKELKFQSQGIKVLSLFFIDKVANYREYNEQGVAEQGKFAIWFEEIYKELINKSIYQSLNKFSINDVHNGYFSQDNKGKLKDTSGETKADEDTYSLIMRDKEKLLDIKNPLKFIFSHSALREGWDNPNVFQICTLNETKSDMKKRQEIGRGLRLAVAQDGKRIYDKNINILTVIANESYDDFAKTLQKEIENDCGVEFSGKIKNKKERQLIKYRKGFEIDPMFLEIWEKIKHRTSYRVYYETPKLIEETSKRIKDLPAISAPQIRSTKVKISMKSENVETLHISEKSENYNTKSWIIPDVIGYIQNRTELTRRTIFDILIKSEKLSEIMVNPQLFMDLISENINEVLADLLLDGIKYQKIESEQYSMELFESQELETYLNDLTFKINDQAKTIYEKFMPLDSKVENKFAKDCESTEQIKFFFKLPNWFKIPTPIGTYNPDWVVIFEDNKKIYFVAETKGSGQELRTSEINKIKCGKKHFELFKNIEYKQVSKVSELIKN